MSAASPDELRCYNTAAPYLYMSDKTSSLSSPTNSATAFWWAPVFTNGWTKKSQLVCKKKTSERRFKWRCWCHRELPLSDYRDCRGLFPLSREKRSFVSVDQRRAILDSGRGNITTCSGFNDHCGLRLLISTSTAAGQPANSLSGK